MRTPIRWSMPLDGDLENIGRPLNANTRPRSKVPDKAGRHGRRYCDLCEDVTRSRNADPTNWWHDVLVVAFETHQPPAFVIQATHKTMWERR